MKAMPDEDKPEVQGVDPGHAAAGPPSRIRTDFNGGDSCVAGVRSAAELGKGPPAAVAAAQASDPTGVAATGPGATTGVAFPQRVEPLQVAAKNLGRRFQEGMWATLSGCRRLAPNPNSRWITLTTTAEPLRGHQATQALILTAAATAETSTTRWCSVTWWSTRREFRKGNLFRCW
jgi:hypothetical protein